MPFIRYRIGDAAAFAQRSCRCGSALPALTSLSGRTMNWIVDAHGSRVAPQRMWVSLYLGDAALLGISRYRVQQDETRRVTIELVADDRFGDDLVERWVAGYRDLLGDVPIEFHRVDHMTYGPTRSSDHQLAGGSSGLSRGPGVADDSNCRNRSPGARRCDRRG